MKMAADTQAEDPVLGKLSFDKVQLCPQNCIQRIDETVIDNLIQEYPDTEFRFHANVKILEKHQLGVNLSNYGGYTKAYFTRMSQLISRLGAKAYTLHAGHRIGKWEKLVSNVSRLEDLLQVPVGIEGLYPTYKPDIYWVNSWHEYEMLFNSGAKYALDLSHLNIVYNQTGILEKTLVEDMISSPNCIEIHVSANDGIRDTHQKLDCNEPPWWMDALKLTNTTADIFYEGNLLKQ